MKQCNKCGLKKPYDEFHKRSTIKSGYQPICKVCRKILDKKLKSNPKLKLKQKECNKNRKLMNRQNIFDYMKDKKCYNCNESHIACLQFDHRDGVQKRFNVADATSYGWSTILKEIEKCDILCANCHHKRTAKQQKWYSDLK